MVWGISLVTWFNKSFIEVSMNGDQIKNDFLTCSLQD